MGVVHIGYSSNGLDHASGQDIQNGEYDVTHRFDIDPKDY